MLPKKEGLPKFIVVALIITLAINWMMSLISQSAFQEIEYSRFLKMLDNNEIKSVQITGDRIIIIPKTDKDVSMADKKMFYTGRLDYPEIYDKLYSSGVDFKTPVDNKQSPIVNFILSWILPF
ncbi:MAG TPA: cell division protein FtsH, partial [Clostridiaceae bacterium]|nr:cell division protein FtsH [Clostridiaceae bacterium]